MKYHENYSSAPVGGDEDYELHYAGVIIETDAGRIIGQLRDDLPYILNPNKVATFGGAIEPEDPTPQDAAYRELAIEEVEGLNLEPKDLSLFRVDTAVRGASGEMEKRYFYHAMVPEVDLENVKVLEGQGWREIVNPWSEVEPVVVEEWRSVIGLFLAQRATRELIEKIRAEES